MHAVQWWLGGLWRGWRGASSDARRAWLWPAVGTTLLAGLLSMALAYAAKRSSEAGLLARDGEWLQAFVDAVPLGVSSAIYLGVPGATIFLSAALVGAVAISLRAGRPFLALAYLATILVADLAIGAAWIVWDRPRPELVIGGAASPGLRSFPSGHVAQALTLYGLSAWVWIRAAARAGEKILAALLLFAVTTLIATTRLELGVHWPSDVVAGFVVGGVLAAGLALAVARAEHASGVD